MSTYVSKLEQRLAELDIHAPLLMMKSSGGVTSVRTMRERPIEAAISGPAAGVVGARLTAASAGREERSISPKIRTSRIRRINGATEDGRSMPPAKPQVATAPP